MAAAKCSDEEFIRLFESMGPRKMARELQIEYTAVISRRTRLEHKYDKRIIAPSLQGGAPRASVDGTYPKRLGLSVGDGIVIVGSDAHYWPDLISPAHRALVKLCSDLSPKAVIMNGDLFDGARVSRHAPLGWQKTPSVKQEMYAVEQRTDEIVDAAKGAELFWLLGNHDMRFENRLSGEASQFEEVQGFRLSDHYPRWVFGLSLWINHDVVVKHRFKGGIHATHNNTLWAGKTVVTGHLHSLKVTPFSDYSGTRFGVDTGTLANPYGPQFEYAEDNPLNHRSGLIVLTFKEGQLLWPEIVAVIDDDHVQFRGEVISV